MKTVKGVVEQSRFRVPYRCYGDQENVLLCVSGALQTMAVWRTVARRFSSNFTVIVFDMPGVGRGEMPAQLQQLHAPQQWIQSDGKLVGSLQRDVVLPQHGPRCVYPEHAA